MPRLENLHESAIQVDSASLEVIHRNLKLAFVKVCIDASVLHGAVLDGFREQVRAPVVLITGKTFDLDSAAAVHSCAVRWSCIHNSMYLQLSCSRISLRFFPSSISDAVGSHSPEPRSGSLGASPGKLRFFSEAAGSALSMGSGWDGTWWYDAAASTGVREYYEQRCFLARNQMLSTDAPI